MSSTRIIPDDARDQFWFVVRACLHEFHKMTSPITQRKTTRLRKRIESLPHEAAELFYHSEPFDVACDVADRRLSLARRRKRYLQLRDETHGTWTLPQVLRRRRA